MATSISAFKIPAGQVPVKRPKSDAERAKAYRQRKAAAKATGLPNNPVADQGPQRNLNLKITPDPVVVGNHAETAQFPPITSVALIAAAFGLAGVGIVQNGWFARTLGSTDTAGWLFLAVGVASDAAALVLPSVCVKAWAARQRGTALAGWSVWIVAFCFAVTAAVGFTALNVTDMTMMRASRVTPAIVTARDGLADAVTARNRECRGGVGRYCREREADVVNRRAILDTAMHDVQATADPQAEAAVRLVAWVSARTLKPTADDFALLRLLLLTVLPQCGGLLLMVAGTRHGPALSDRF